MDWLNALINFFAALLAAIMLFFAGLLPVARIETPAAPAAPATSTPTLPGNFPAAATTTQPAATAKPAAGKPAAQPVAPAPAAQPSAPPAPEKSQEQINTETRAALVNILCLTQTGLHGISGSGVIVDSRGVVLTNAHIGQYFLLRDYRTPGNVDCTIRVGSPAERRYRATLLYLPPEWVRDNASQLVAAQATGTGENDYAFLLITGTTDPAGTLPGSFARLPMDMGYPDIGVPMLLAAYPAGFLGGETVEKNLYVSSAITYATQLFSFGSSVVDLFSIGGTVLSQAGSSGGAVVRLGDGKLSGLIVTATVGDFTSGRDLRALTLAHINTSLTLGGHAGVVGLLTGDLSAKAAVFAAATAPLERAALIKVLDGN